MQEAKDEANLATITVSLPRWRPVTFDGATTVSTGPGVFSTSPALQPGKDFHYMVRAQVTRDGKTETAQQGSPRRRGNQLICRLPNSRPLLGESLTHEGKVVRVTENNLTMADKDGKNEHRHAVARDTKISLDGKECKLEDIKRGMRVRVTTTEGDKDHTVSIEGTSAN